MHTSKNYELVSRWGRRNVVPFLAAWCACACGDASNPYFALPIPSADLVDVAAETLDDVGDEAGVDGLADSQAEIADVPEEGNDVTDDERPADLADDSEIGEVDLDVGDLDDVEFELDSETEGGDVSDAAEGDASAETAPDGGDDAEELQDIEVEIEDLSELEVEGGDVELDAIDSSDLQFDGDLSAEVSDAQDTEVVDVDADAGSGDGLDDLGDETQPDISIPSLRYCEVNFCEFDTAFDDLEGLEETELRDELAARIVHSGLGYNAARNAMYSTLDVWDGNVQCLYTGTQVAADGTRTPGGIINTEHVWPRSLGAEAEPALSDLHHLFPTTQTSNSARSSFLFGETLCNATAVCGWFGGGSELGASWVNGSTVFEVRTDSRGDVARATFYFSVRYALPIDDREEAELRQWNLQDPPDAREFARNDAIELLQGNRNPFVDRPDFVDSILEF